MGGAVLSCLSKRLEKAIVKVITPQLSGLVVALKQFAVGAKVALAGSGTSPGRRGVQAIINTFPASCPADVIALCTPLSPSALAKEWALLGSSESMDVQIVADFCRLFGHHEGSALSILDGSSPPPKTHPCQQSPSLLSAGGHVGSIINQAYPRAVSVKGSECPRTLGEVAKDGLGKVGSHSLGVKRDRDLPDEHELRWEPRGGSYANGLFLPSSSHILGSSKSASVDVLRGLGATVGLGTLASRRDSMRRLAQLGGALTSSLGPTQSFLKMGGDGVALRHEAGVGAGVGSGDAALPFVTIPLVVGNTSDWLGEKASATANHRWTIYVRGVNNASLSGIVDHVTFVLHPSFPKPQQTVYREPFMLTEHGWGEFDVTVYVKFKHIEIPVVASLTSPNAVSSPTFGAATVAANRGIYVKLTHSLKFSHRNPMLLAAESRVNQDVAVAMTQPPSVLFGTSAPSTSPAIPGGTNVQSVQFLLTNPTLTTAIPALPETPAAVVHKLHCFPPNGNAYYGVPNYTPFALVDSTVASETRDELAIFHPSPTLLAEVASYITACAAFTPAALATSLPPAMFSKLMKHSPLLCYSSGKFNEWYLYSHQSLQDKRLLTAVEADLGALMRRYVTPMARDEMRSTALLQLKQVGVQ